MLFTACLCVVCFIGGIRGHAVQQDILWIVCLSIWKSEFWFHWWDLRLQKPDDSERFKAQLVYSSGAAGWAVGLSSHSRPICRPGGATSESWPRPCVARPSCPWASPEVVRPAPRWHRASRSAVIVAENSPPIHHGGLPAFLLHWHFS